MLSKELTGADFYILRFYAVIMNEEDVKREKRIVTKFLVKRGKTNNEIRNELQLVYGTDTLKAATIKKLPKRFREGRMSTDDDPRDGRPSTARNAINRQRVEAFVKKDRR